MSIKVPPTVISPTGSANSDARSSASPRKFGPAAGRDTVVVVISEFGRTFRENGDRGTDHGHGSVYWVLGGGINGGRILGEQVKEWSSPHLFQNRDYPVLTDYRALFADLFGHVLRPQQQRASSASSPACTRRTWH